METTNSGRSGRWQIREFPVPWKPYEIEENKILIHENIVKVFSFNYYYRGIIFDREPCSACFADRDLLVRFPDGMIRKFADDGCWGTEFVGRRLIIQGNDLLVLNGAGDSLTIRNEKPVNNAQWYVYGGRHVIRVVLPGEVRLFSSPGFFEHEATVKEMMDSMQKLCDKLNAGRPPVEEKPTEPPDPGTMRLNVTFYPGF